MTQMMLYLSSIIIEDGPSFGDSRTPTHGHSYLNSYQSMQVNKTLSVPLSTTLACKCPCCTECPAPATSRFLMVGLRFLRFLCSTLLPLLPTSLCGMPCLSLTSNFPAPFSCMSLFVATTPPLSTARPAQFHCSAD